MNSEIINWVITEVQPEANRTGSPEGALLKVASDRNLPPAALERMAQLWNAGRTIHHFEKSANRAASVPIVDVPELLENYSSYVPDQPVVGYAAQEVKPFPGLNLFGEAPQSLVVKLASEIEHPQVEKTATDAYRERKALKAQADLCLEYLDCLNLDKQAAAERILKKATELHTEWRPSQAVAMLVRRHGKKAAAAVEYLDKFLRGRANVHPEDLTKVAACHPVDVRNTPELDALEVIQDCLAQEEGTLDYLGECEAAYAEKRATMTMEPPRKREERTESRAPGSESPTETRSARGVDTPSTQAPKSTSGKKPQGTTAVTGAPRPTQIQKHRDVGINDVLMSLASGSSIGGRLDRLLSGMDIDQGQRVIDRAVEDTHNQAILQDLMINDDVLSEADPDEVAGYYQTLLTVSPELVKDRNVLATMLRKMVHTEGTDPLSIGTFADTQAKLRKNQEEASLAEKRRYEPKTKQKVKAHGG